MNFKYRLLRKKGWLFFNSSFPNQKYWVSVQAACQGGGGMYAEISLDEFEAVWQERVEPNSFEKYFVRDWDSKREQFAVDQHKLDDVIELHDLAQYADGPKVVRSVVTHDA